MTVVLGKCSFVTNVGHNNSNFKGVRNPEAARKSVEKCLGELLNGAKISFEKCDTGDMESVRNFAKKVQEKFSAIHLLINNGKLKKFCENKNHLMRNNFQREFCTFLTK